MPEYDMSKISEPEHPPTLEGSMDVIQSIMLAADTIEGAIAALAVMHLSQAIVIRGERGRAEQAEAELVARELHHFEVEQENERLKAEERCDFDCDVCREDEND